MEISQPFVKAPLTAPATEPPATAALSSDFDTFLRMLTVQMENQDPLNPIQSSDYAVQLATFSSVEQQIRTNELLETMSGGSFSGLAQVAAWVGMEARAPVAARWDGANPVALYPDLPASADQATLITRDAAGLEVARTAIPVSDDPISWVGADADGAILPPGFYSFTIEARAAGAVIAAEPVDVYAPITEARLAPEGPEIVFASGDALPAGDVAAIRLPPG